jgi:hypothetical protein
VIGRPLLLLAFCVACCVAVLALVFALDRDADDLRRQQDAAIHDDTARCEAIGGFALLDRRREYVIDCIVPNK